MLLRRCSEALESRAAGIGKGLLHDQVTLMMEGSSSFGACDPAGD
ncbi:hypothetical protein [Nocardia testacea]